MSVVIRIIGLASGAPSMNAGQYLQSFDAEAHGGRGEIMCTPVLAQAMRFDHAGQAHAFWKQSPRCKPRRSDGRPNRPLTAFTVDVFDPEKAAELDEPGRC